MKLPKEFILEIPTWGLKELWEHLQHLEQDDEIDMDTYSLIKNGIRIPCHIGHLIESRRVEKQKNGIVIINRKAYKIEDVWDEIDKRKTLMRAALYNNINEAGTTKPRI